MLPLGVVIRFSVHQSLQLENCQLQVRMMSGDILVGNSLVSPEWLGGVDREMVCGVDREWSYSVDEEWSYG